MSWNGVSFRRVYVGVWRGENETREGGLGPGRSSSVVGEGKEQARQGRNMATERTTSPYEMGLYNMR